VRRSQQSARILQPSKTPCCLSLGGKHERTDMSLYTYTLGSVLQVQGRYIHGGGKYTTYSLYVSSRFVLLKHKAALNITNIYVLYTILGEGRMERRNQENGVNLTTIGGIVWQEELVAEKNTRIVSTSLMLEG